VDDCWLTKERDESKRVIVDKERFPDGMRAVGDYIHSQGLKYGIYNSAGTMTCESKAGSLYHEKIDVADFVEWGVDYLKYDNCFNEGVPSLERYTAMKNALENAHRPIFYSICNWGLEDVWEWGNSTGNSWRTAGDITPTWPSVKYNFEMNQLHPESAGPGGWNDPDMLEVGNGGLTHAEEKSHFALWCFAKAPLILGCDLNTITPESLAIISNKNLIAIN
jgi:alpha-galactosidase